MTRLNWIDATGFGKQAKRELKLCDLCNILMLHWDDNNGIENRLDTYYKDVSVLNDLLACK